MERQEDHIFPAVKQDESIEFPTAESDEEIEIRLLKKKAQKVKIIALEQLRKPIFSNPSNFVNREKAKLLKLMKEWFDKPDEIIDELFNEIVLDKLETEFEKIPVNPMNITYAPDPEYHKDLPPMETTDIAGNQIQISAL
jgi:CTP:phosphocholine cytidylyltransferase-like protein